MVAFKESKRCRENLRDIFKSSQYKTFFLLIIRKEIHFYSFRFYFSARLLFLASNILNNLFFFLPTFLAKPSEATSGNRHVIFTVFEVMDRGD